MNKLIKFKASGFTGDIDTTNNILKEVVLMEPNREATGHGLFIDDVIVSQVVTMGNSSTEGFKARFDHPNACATSLGTQLGRLKNFKLKGGKAVADLHLAEFAKHSPSGDLATWVMKVAEEDPDQIGFSVVFLEDEPVMLDAKKGEDADSPEFAMPHVRIKTFMGADVVEIGAATSSLFEDGIMGRPNYLAEQAQHFLSERKELVKELFKPMILELVTELNDNTNQNQLKMSDNKVSLSDSLKEFYAKHFGEEGKVADIVPEVNNDLEAAQTQLASKATEIEALKAEIETSKEALDASKVEFNQSIEDIKSEFEALKSKSLGTLVEDVATADVIAEKTPEQLAEFAESNKQDDLVKWINEGFTDNTDN